MKTVPPWDEKMAAGVHKWIGRFSAIRDTKPPHDIEDLFHMNLALLLLVATSLVAKTEDGEDLVKLDSMAKAAFKSMLLELGHEADQQEAPEEAGGSL